MYTIVNINNEVLGYTIDNYFIDSNTFKYLFDNTPKSIESKLGVSTKYGVVTSDEIYQNYDKDFNLDVLKNSKLNLMSIIFVPCNSDDIRFKQYYDSFGHIFNNYICINTSDFSQVAYLVTTSDLYKVKEVHIAMLESINKKKHVGTNVVAQLKYLGKTLSGLSLISAIGFWKKQGALLDSNNYFTI
jgi:hypothetical protein